MNTQKVLIGGVVVAVLLSVMAFFHGGSQGPAGSNGNDGQTLGAVSGPDISSPYLSVNGVTTWYNKVALQQATTTICSIKSPSATSTLDLFTLHMNVATTGGATTLTLARATFGASASTTQFSTTQNVASGAEVNMSVSSSSPIFTPNQMLNVTQAGGGTFIGGTFSEGGWCQANFVTLTN